MDIFHDAQVFQKNMSMIASSGRAITLVPTMGALHLGHLSLIHEAKKNQNSYVVVSIYVNPTQFDRQEDFTHYPKTWEEDIQYCLEAGVDAVFAPETLYEPDHSIMIHEKKLSQYLCGAARLGHFDGVCTIVLKLFMLSCCTHAIFGQKDFQQLAIIQRMVRDLNLRVTILSLPTYREPDGLAMSSRNQRLTPTHRSEACNLFRALQATKDQLLNGHDLKHALQTLQQKLELLDLRVDYLECVNANDLTLCQNIQEPCIIALAVFFGEVRLIDHIHIPAIVKMMEPDFSNQTHV